MKDEYGFHKRMTRKRFEKIKRKNKKKVYELLHDIDEGNEQAKNSKLHYGNALVDKERSYE